MKIFVYGSLMMNMRNNYLLDDSKYIGDAYILDYALYEISWFPGIKRKEGFKVYGEVYEIDEETKKRLDYYEGVDSDLYKHSETIAYLDNKQEEVYFYEYLGHVNECSLRYPKGKWSVEKQFMNNYVWYAVYGSNLLKERFDKYIEYTTSKRQPIDEKPYAFNHNVYFAKKSRTWKDSGVAFLDYKNEGKALGYMYLITKEQFQEIKCKEGPGKEWYGREVSLGYDEKGIEIKTITQEYKTPHNKPSDDYLDIIAAGLIQKGLINNLDNFEDLYGMNYKPNIDDKHIKEILDRLN